MPTKNPSSDTKRVSIDLIGSEATPIKIASDLKRFNKKIICLENSDLNLTGYDLLGDNDSKRYALVRRDKDNNYCYHLFPLSSQTKETDSSSNKKSLLDSAVLEKVNLSVSLASQEALKAMRIAIKENKAEFSESGLSNEEIDTLFKDEKLIRGGFQLKVYPENLPSYDIARLISRNMSIPNLLKTLTPDTPEVIELKRAIEQADFSSDIWNNKNCNVYVLYLMSQLDQKGQPLISFNEGITAYMALIAFMQLTSRQKLKEEDAKQVKKDYPVSIQPMVADGKLIKLGDAYAESVANYCTRINRKIDVEDVKKYILSLPRIEQHLIYSEYDKNLKDPLPLYIDEFLNDVISSTIPIVISSSSSSMQGYFVPSFSIIQFIFNKINSEPVMLVPIFGNMGLNTLYQWHKSGLHPFNLYAPQAQTNQPLIIDGYLSGPWPALLHDIFHAQGMNLLSTKGRQRIFDQFISVVSLLQERIISRAADFDTETEIKSRENYLTDIIERLYDFNLSVPSAYSEQKERIISWSEFKNYLKNCIERLYNFIFSRPKNYSEQKVTLNRYLRFAFTKVFPNDSLDSNMLYSSNENAIKPIGFPIADHMYFLLHQFLHEPQYAGYKDTISFILNSVDNTGQFRDPKVLLALRTVAKNAVKNPNKLIADPNALKSCQVDWFEWVKLIYSTDDSLPLWIKINNDSARRQELLRMMSKGFTFFSFHLKMTEEKKGEFKTFLFTLLKDEQIFGLFERAITDKNLDRFKDLIKYKANINVESDCLTPLYIVAERGYKDMVTLLLDHPSCNVDIRNAWGGTALSVASINGYPGIVKLLLDKGADPYATFTKSFASSERATLLDKVIGNIGIKSKKDENQYIEKQYEIAKILIEAMVLKKLNKPKPSVLEKNEELSGYWDELNKKGVETNKEMQHSDKHGFFQNKGRVKVSEIPRNGPREEGRPSLSSSRCVLQ